MPKITHYLAALCAVKTIPSKDTQIFSFGAHNFWLDEHGGKPEDKAMQFCLNMYPVGDGYAEHDVVITVLHPEKVGLMQKTLKPLCFHFHLSQILECMFGIRKGMLIVSGLPI